MATSSIFKNFVLDAVETENFVKLLAESEKNPQPLNEVKFTRLSKEKIKELIDERRKQKI